MMVIKLKTDDSLRGLVNRFTYADIDIKVGEPVGIWSVKDRQWSLRGTKGIIRRIYFQKFGRYTICWLSLFLPSFDKTIWVEADACEFGEGSWALYA